VRRVIVESPYAGNIELNLRYLRACMADCIRRGEAPFASHGLYTQPGVLRDDVPEERMAGIHAGFGWRCVADATVVYTDLGTSTGMGYGIKAAEQLIAERAHHVEPICHVIEYRSLVGTFTDNGATWDDGIFATGRWGK
jgi:hypothetical protein